MPSGSKKRSLVDQDSGGETLDFAQIRLKSFWVITPYGVYGV